MIGGKLTTCRSLAESAAATILNRLGRTPLATSRDRSLPGAENLTVDPAAQAAYFQKLATEFSFSIATIEAIHALIGTRTEWILSETRTSPDALALLSGTLLPRRLARWMIDHEWAATLGDLIERRLMLLYDPQLTRECLIELAKLLVAAGRLPPSQIEVAIQTTINRLRNHFGKSLEHGQAIA